jgi:hypothetical protein
MPQNTRQVHKCQQQRAVPRVHVLGIPKRLLDSVAFALHTAMTNDMHGNKWPARERAPAFPHYTKV